MIGNPSAPCINTVLSTHAANFTRMFGEEHYSQGSYTVVAMKIIHEGRMT